MTNSRVSGRQRPVRHDMVAERRPGGQQLWVVGHYPVHIEYGAEGAEYGSELRVPVRFVERGESSWRWLSHGSKLADLPGPGHPKVGSTTEVRSAVANI